VTSFEKVLDSACCDRSGEITEGKKVCYWNGKGSSVTKIRDILEYVVVENRTLMFSSEDKELEEDSSLSGSEWRCAITIERLISFLICGRNHLHHPASRLMLSSTVTGSFKRPHVSTRL
jgi:hypothetical protein